MIKSKALCNKLKDCFLLLLVVLCLFFNLSNVIAQNVTTSATLDTNVILIGQQTKLHLIVTHPKNVSLQFPFVPDTLSKVEFISKSKIDTISSDANNITRKQDVTLTAWDSGFFVITPFIFTYKNTGDTTNYTAETQPLLLTTNVIPVDTTKAIRDITKPIAVGLSWQEMIPYIVAVLAILLLAGIIYYLKKRKVPVSEVITPKIPPKPAHIIAVAELDALKEEKLWQQGYIKQYHTRITEIVRAYIGRRYDVDALEMTTDDILKLSQINHLKDANYDQVKYLLQLADLAKFAKAQPLANENEQALSSAYLFVDATKEQAAQQTEKKEVSNV